jgi:hypothetical protein
MESQKIITEEFNLKNDNRKIKMNYNRNNSNNFSLTYLSSSITPILNIDPDATRALGGIEPPGSTQF